MFNTAPLTRPVGFRPSGAGGLAASFPYENPDLANEYDLSLQELSFNSKPMINSLTMVAEENIRYSRDLAHVLVERIRQAPVDRILSLVYVLDSILKNVGGIYVTLFAPHLSACFSEPFSRGDPDLRQALLKVLQTWVEARLFAPELLQALESHARMALMSSLSPPPPPPALTNPTSIAPRWPSVPVNADRHPVQVTALPVSQPDSAPSETAQQLTARSRRGGRSSAPEPRPTPATAAAQPSTSSTTPALFRPASTSTLRKSPPRLPDRKLEKLSNLFIDDDRDLAPAASSKGEEKIKKEQQVKQEDKVAESSKVQEEPLRRGGRRGGRVVSTFSGNVDRLRGDSKDSSVVKSEPLKEKDKELAERERDRERERERDAERRHSRERERRGGFRGRGGSSQHRKYHDDRDDRASHSHPRSPPRGAAPISAAVYRDVSGGGAPSFPLPTFPMAPVAQSSTAAPVLPVLSHDSESERLHQEANEQGIEMSPETLVETEAMLLGELHFALHKAPLPADLTPADILNLRSAIVNFLMQQINHNVPLEPSVSELLKQLDLLDELKKKQRPSAAPVPSFVSQPLVAPPPLAPSLPVAQPLPVPSLLPDLAQVSSLLGSQLGPMGSLLTPLLTPLLGGNPLLLGSQLAPVQVVAPPPPPPSTSSSAGPDAPFDWLKSVLSKVGAPSHTPPQTPKPALHIDMRDPTTLRQRNDVAISQLFDLPLQCEMCGLRFSNQEKMQPHLDAHFRQNRREREMAKKAQSRLWYQSETHWIDSAAVTADTPAPFEETEAKTPEQVEEVREVPVGDDDRPVCQACLESIQVRWDDVREEWMAVGAVRDDDGDLYHYKCIAATGDDGAEDSERKGLKRDASTALGDDDDDGEAHKRAKMEHNTS